MIFHLLNQKCYFYGNTQHYVHACDWVKGQTGAKVHGGGWLDGVYPQIGDWGLGTGQQM